MEIYHYYGNDLLLDTNGDLLSASGPILTQQSLLRRLITAAPNYKWEQTYGAGIGSNVGLALSAQRFNTIKATIISQVYLEDTIAKTPAPTITIKQTGINTINCTILYYDAITNQPFVLSFNATSAQ
jgi:hypothetical protein